MRCRRWYSALFDEVENFKRFGKFDTIDLLVGPGAYSINYILRGMLHTGKNKILICFLAQIGSLYDRGYRFLKDVLISRTNREP